MTANGLERRVRTLEEELNGERHVSRYMVEQAGRNSEVLHAVRAEIGAVTVRVDVLSGDMVSVKAALAMHGRALDVMQQDIRQVRGEMAELHRGQAAMRGELTAVREEMRQEFTAVREEMRQEFTAAREEMAERHAELLAAVRALGGGAPPA
jgi:hypothetical protein